MPNILIVHGWSDNYQSFLPLKRLLQNEGYKPEDVVLGNYASMQDQLTFDDVSYGLQMRLRGLVEQRRILGELNDEHPGGFSLEPFSLDVIVHSTGGPVVRNWLTLYLRDVCGGDFTKSPIRHLIMLAPANFGSRLAAQGKSTLAKLFKGHMASGFETGRKILEGLELGSPFLWDLAERDLFGGKLYPSTNSGTFLYVLSGTDTYGALKGLVAKGASENGSDGTIRAASASLNSIKLAVDLRDPANPKRPTVTSQLNVAHAFKLVEGCNHSTIIPDLKAGADHPAFKIIKECLQVRGVDDHETLRNKYARENDDLYARNKQFRAQNSRVDPINRFQQFIVRVSDNMDNAVTDYRLDFHVIDDRVENSAWVGCAVPEGLCDYKEYNARILDEVVCSVEPHSLDASYRTFFVNIDALNALLEDLARNHPQAYVAMNLDALPSAPGVCYRTDLVKYFRLVPFPDEDGSGKSFFAENTSTLVEIKLQLHVDETVVSLH